MAEVLPLAYGWQAPAVGSTVVLAIVLAVLIHGRTAGWGAVALIAVGLWLLFLTAVYLRTRAYLAVDGSRLTVRRYRTRHVVEAPQLVGVHQFLTSRGPSYTLLVRRPDGGVARYVAPVALLARGHSTLFAWILAEAPQAELDRGSQRTVDRLKIKGLLP